MKKYFKFTEFKKCLKPFILFMAVLVICQYYTTHMSISKIIKADLIITVIFVFASLVVDWIHMKSNNLKK